MASGYGDRGDSVSGFGDHGSLTSLCDDRVGLASGFFDCGSLVKSCCDCGGFENGCRIMLAWLVSVVIAVAWLEARKGSWCSGLARGCGKSDELAVSGCGDRGGMVEGSGDIQ